MIFTVDDMAISVQVTERVCGHYAVTQFQSPETTSVCTETLTDTLKLFNKSLFLARSNFSDRLLTYKF